MRDTVQLTEKKTSQAARTWVREPVAVYLEAKRVLGKTDQELCLALGYSDNAGHGWMSAGNMPAVAARLCRVWIEQEEEKMTRPNSDRVMMVRLRQEKDQVVLQAVAKGLVLEWAVV